ncbi:MAG: diacylglycerol kinase family protein, partial [Gemmatimonadota bacterium]
VDLFVTRAPGEAGRMAAECDHDRVLVCGGDGTVGDVAAALAHRATPLGILPSGRGNDFAAVLGIPVDRDRAVDVFLSGVVRTVDLGRANDRLFCTVAGIGFDAEVNRRVQGWPWRLLGRWSYTVGVVAYLPGFRLPTMTVTGPFGRVERRGYLVAVSNGGRYGGGIRIAPDSSPDDGLLDVCLVGEVGRLELLRLLPTAYSGGHVLHPAVTMYRGDEIVVETDRPMPVVADGEPLGQTPVRFTVAPAALRVVVPQ